MRNLETVKVDPIAVEKSVRGDEIRVLTSCKAGKIVPVAYVPILREDRVSRGSIRLSLQMAETVFPLMNAVNVTAFAHFVPFSSFDRFDGMDSFNRAYQGVPEPSTGKPLAFFTALDFKRDVPFWKTLGVHWKEGEPINIAPVEAYNTLVNWRRRVRSEKIPQRQNTDGSLAEAFWRNPNMWHIVPDYDKAMMDGEVALSWTRSRAPVSGIAFAGQPAKFQLPSTVTNGLRQTGKRPVTATDLWMRTGENINGNTLAVLEDAQNKGFPEIFAELASAGVKLSLSNIEQAKQTAAFARLRGQFAGLEDDHIIDLLMEGIRVPEEALRQPILLDKKSTIFGYTERHAMDGANLEKSVTTGQTEVTLRFRTPEMNSGGIILITVEIVPEQLFERQYDTFLGMKSGTQLPSFVRDFLDPDKVSIVQNQYVDVHHGQPTATFGFAPLNHAWKRSLARIGGRYYRPAKDAFVEDRQRFWSSEPVNPTLTKDFYLVGNLPHTVFADRNADPFEITALGNVEIVGNTVFGKGLEENRGDYRAVQDEAGA